MRHGEFSRRGLDPAKFQSALSAQRQCGSFVWGIFRDGIVETYECPEYLHRTVIVIRRRSCPFGPACFKLSTLTDP